MNENYSHAFIALKGKRVSVCILAIASGHGQFFRAQCLYYNGNYNFVIFSFAICYFNTQRASKRNAQIVKSMGFTEHATNSHTLFVCVFVPKCASITQFNHLRSKSPLILREVKVKIERNTFIWNIAVRIRKGSFAFEYSMKIAWICGKSQRIQYFYLNLFRLNKHFCASKMKEQHINGYTYTRERQRKKSTAVI